ncbi:LysE/ArgO family amino acid transporter [Acidothermaceae bacterium B102]|nr:LysE/ArgO family amino acid transporter [Acidothermaceae bacterium B102]
MITATAGLFFGLSLVVVIGAQNTYVLRVGVLQQHVLPVVLICTVSDAVLIAAGVGGAGVALDSRPWLLRVVRWAGAAFLIAYGVRAGRRALHPARVDSESGRAALTLPAAIASAVALTWLNPGVYLDTVVLLGSVAHNHAQPWLFAAGAAVASLLWFFALGYGARLAHPLLASRRAWQALDAFVALVMVTTAVRVLAG